MSGLAAALEEAGIKRKPKPEALVFLAPETMISPQTLFASRVIMIPATFVVDEHGFMYYLKANDVDHQQELVNVLEEGPGGQLRNIPMREFFFPSDHAYDAAQSIWQALTGCKVLGKLDKWQSWDKFR